LLSIVKKGREQIQSDGMKAAKFLGKKGHEAWGKIKKGKNGPTVPPTSSSSGSRASYRDTSNDIDVFGMELRDAVDKTRIIKERKNPGEAAYWMPALAYRCLQYVLSLQGSPIEFPVCPTGRLLIVVVPPDILMCMVRRNLGYIESRGVHLLWTS
jgi:hypothetical protein